MSPIVKLGFFDRICYNKMKEASMAWYWWALIAVVVIAIVWWLIAKRK